MALADNFVDVTLDDWVDIVAPQVYDLADSVVVSNLDVIVVGSGWIVLNKSVASSLAVVRS